GQLKRPRTPGGEEGGQLKRSRTPGGEEGGQLKRSRTSRREKGAGSGALPRSTLESPRCRAPRCCIGTRDYCDFALTSAVRPRYARAMSKTRLAMVAALLIAVAHPAAGSGTPAQKCEAAAGSALATCVQKVGARTRKCYLDTGAPCAPTDERSVQALAKVGQKVLARCPDAATVQAAGFGAFATPAALVDRLKEACAGDPATLAARTFGGPQGALLVGATAATRNCLETAMSESV